MPVSRPVLLLFVLSFAVTACRRPEITSYRIPKERDPQMPAANSAAMPANSGAGTDMTRTAVATAQGAALTWTAPAHWRPKPASAMRKGSYAVPGEGGAAADMSITAFPSDVGGELANVNRWRQQIQLPPITAAELPAVIVRHRHNGLDVGEVDLAGTGENAQRILGAWVPFGGATWFFKLMGPDAIVAGEKAAFSAFLDTVKPAEAARTP